MSNPSAQLSPRNPAAINCQLLVSVRDCQEAEVCIRSKVDWIDLKEPRSGSLGMPSMSTAYSVYEVLRNHARRSVALGELADQPSISDIHYLSQLFPVVKLGLAGMAAHRDWPEQLSAIQEHVAGSLVPVIYADWSTCHAPSPSEILQWMLTSGSPFLLVDTFHKDGSNLLEHMDTSQLAAIIHQAASIGASVLLAGSLTVAQLPAVLALPCTAVAVRGAVCSTDRRGTISPDLVKHWVDVVRGKISLPTT